MGWDAHLTVVDVDGNEHTVGGWGYTHNTNKMIGVCLEGIEMPDYWAKHLGPAWFDLLDKQTVKGTLPILEQIITQLEATPDRFLAMNPDNGWGDYEGILEELKKMHETAVKYPSAKWWFWG